MGELGKFHCSTGKPNARKVICSRPAGPLICLPFPFEAGQGNNAVKCAAVEYVVHVLQSLAVRAWKQVCSEYKTDHLVSADVHEMREK